MGDTTNRRKTTPRVPAAADMDPDAIVRRAYWHAQIREKALHKELIAAVRVSAEKPVAEIRKALVDALDELDRLRPLVEAQRNQAGGRGQSPGGIGLKFPRRGVG